MPGQFVRTFVSVVFATVMFPAFAQAQSAIAGLVTDATGAVLPGVTVEAASPALIEKVRTAVTDAQGRYAIVNVRPGEYAVTFSLQGFASFKRAGITVAADTSVPLNVQLGMGAVEETITVSGASPIVDVQQAARSQVLAHEVLDTIPTARTIGTVGAVVPGVKLSKPDLGGTSQVEQAIVTARGKKGEDAAMEVNGVDSRIASSSGEAYTNFGMMQEVTYQTAALSAESAGTGMRINIIPREGGNVFHGDAYYAYSNSNLQSSNLSAELRAKGLKSTDGIMSMSDFNPSIGGPLLRDRVWFFGSYRQVINNLKRAGSFYPDGTPGGEDTGVNSVSANVTWQMSPRNKLSVYYDQPFKYKRHEGFLAPASTGGPGEWTPAGTQLDAATSRREAMKQLYLTSHARWTSTINNKMFFDASYGHDIYNFHLDYQDGIAQQRGTAAWLAGAPRLDFIRGTLTTAPFTPIRDGNNLQGRLASSLSYVTGSHNIKGGAAFRRTVNYGAIDANADLIERFRDGVADSVDIRMTPAKTEGGLDSDVALFLQDAWTLKRLTLNAGARFERVKGSVHPTEMPAGRFVPARNVPESSPLPVTAQWAPRFSAVYDLFGNAKTALKISAGKYLNGVYADTQVLRYSPVPANVLTNFDRRNWFDCDVNSGTSTCSGRTLPTNGDGIAQDNEIGPTSNRSFGFAVTRRADPNLKRPNDWDYTVGVQHQLAPRVAVSATWYLNKFYNLEGSTNTIVALADFSPFTVANPLGGDRITVYKLAAAKQGLVDTVDFNSSTNSRTYTGYEISMDARLPGGGTLLAGWLAERTVSTTCDTNDPNQFRFCDQSGELYQELGAVSGMPFRHEFKMAASYALPWRFHAGLSLLSYPGAQKDVSYSVPANLFPGGRTNAVTSVLTAPGTSYYDRWNQLDARFSRTFTVAKKQIEPTIEGFNLANSSVVLSEITAFGASLGSPSTTIQGRLLKFTVKVKY
jgi:hypothetical protein